MLDKSRGHLATIEYLASTEPVHPYEGVGASSPAKPTTPAPVDDPDEFVDFIRAQDSAADELVEIAVEAQISRKAAESDAIVALLRQRETAVVREELRLMTRLVDRMSGSNEKTGLHYSHYDDPDNYDEAVLDELIGTASLSAMDGDRLRLLGLVACAEALAVPSPGTRVGSWPTPADPDEALALDEFYRQIYEIGETHAVPVEAFDGPHLLVGLHKNRLAMLEPSRVVYEYLQESIELASRLDLPDESFDLLLAQLTDQYQAKLRDDLHAQTYESLLEAILATELDEQGLVDGDRGAVDYKLTLIEQASLVYYERRRRIHAGSATRDQYDLTFSSPVELLQPQVLTRNPLAVDPGRVLDQPPQERNPGIGF